MIINEIVYLPSDKSLPVLPSSFDFPFLPSGKVEAELLHTYSRIDPYDTLILCVRVAVLTAVTLTVPIVLFPVSARSATLIFLLPVYNRE